MSHRRRLATLINGRRIAALLLLLSLPHWALAWEAPILLEGSIKVTAEELLDLKAEFADLVIINIHPGDASQSINIEGAVTVSEQTLSPHTLAALTKDKFTPLVIFGADEHSVHSYKAARQAVSLGYTYVFWFRGGLQEWLDKGMPVVQVQK
ncbi:rhodanese-like domain-containing protein [Kaarinaea lacus]